MSYHFNGIVSIDTFSSLSPQGAIVSVSVDTASDLPTVATIKTDWGVTPIINSTAKVVDDGSTYVLNSQGTWVQQPGQVFQNTYTKNEVDTLLSAKQDTLTFDTVPTEDSTNPVESGGVWSPLAELVDNGAKNKLPVYDLNILKAQNTGGTWTGNVYDFRGVTYTINDDFTISATGTATGGNANLILSKPGGFTIESGQWVLSGCPAGGSASTYNLSIAGTASDIGNTAAFTSCTSVIVRIYIIEGTTANNLLFKPMVCSKAMWDISKTYQSYALSNPELTVDVNGSSGYKMVPCSVANTLEYTGISFTVPANSITLIGAFDIYNGCAPQRLVLSNNADPEAAGFHFVYDTGTVSNTFLQLNLCTIYYNIANAERTLYLHAARYAASASGNRCGYWTKNLATPVLLT